MSDDVKLPPGRDTTLDSGFWAPAKTVSDSLILERQREMARFLLEHKLGVNPIADLIHQRILRAFQRVYGEKLERAGVDHDPA